MEKEQMKEWIQSNLMLQDEAREVTGQSKSAFNQSVATERIKPFVVFGQSRKTRLYLKEEMEEYAQTLNRRNYKMNKNMIDVYEEVAGKIDLNYYDGKGKYVTLYNDFDELLEENEVFEQRLQEHFNDEHDKEFNFSEASEQEFKQAIVFITGWKVPEFTKEQASKPFVLWDYVNSEHRFFGEGNTSSDIVDFVTAP